MNRLDTSNHRQQSSVSVEKSKKSHVIWDTGLLVCVCVCVCVWSWHSSTLSCLCISAEHEHMNNVVQSVYSKTVSHARTATTEHTHTHTRTQTNITPPNHTQESELHRQCSVAEVCIRTETLWDPTQQRHSKRCGFYVQGLGRSGDKERPHSLTWEHTRLAWLLMCGLLNAFNYSSLVNGSDACSLK